MWGEALVGFAAAFVIWFVFSTLFCKDRSDGCQGNGEKPLPPGSMGLPFIGETLQYVTPFKSSTIGPFLHERMSRYGHVFKTNIFGQPTIITTTAESNQFVFQNEGRLFKCAYPAGFVNIVGKYNILQTHGSMHKTLRQLSLNLVGFENLKDRLLPDVETQVMRNLSRWEDGSVINLKDEAANMTFIMLMNRLIGFDSETAESKILMQRFADFMSGLCALPIKLPGTTYTKCLKGRDHVTKTLTNIISERKRLGRRSVNTDFLDKVLEYQADHDDEEFSDHVIVDFLFAFLLAGYDTTSIAMTMAVQYLTENPKALQQLRREHEALLLAKKQKQEKMLNWEDYKSMEFTRSVIKETLRLSNVGPFLFRECVQDTEIKGYRIPKGWKVVACTTAVSHDPAIFPEPSCFNPWRWQGENMAEEKHLQVFGGGSRYCVGAELAKLEMAVFLHRLVTNFSWDRCEGEIIRSPLVLFKNGYTISVRKRVS